MQLVTISSQEYKCNRSLTLANGYVSVERAYSWKPLEGGPRSDDWTTVLVIQ